MQKGISMKKYLTVKELAERWSMHTGSLSNWRVHKKGPAFVKLEGKILYAEEDVEEFEAKSLKNRDDNETLH